MAYIKTDWEDGDVITEAGLDHLENGVYNNSVAIGDLTDLDTTDKTNLVAAINEAAQSGGGGGGMSNAVKDALLQLASKVAYIDEDGQDYYDDLYNALYPAAEIVSINAEYTQTGTVYTTTSLEDLRNDLVVTAIYDNGSVVPVISYTLSGTLTVGESTITATYSGFTDTFDVTVSAVPTVSSIAAVYTQSGTVYDTDSLDSLKADLVVTATYSDSSTATVPSADYTLSGTLAVGTSTVTVSYESKTTTFNVTVTDRWALPSGYTKYDYVLNNNTTKTAINTGVAFAYCAPEYEHEIKFAILDAFVSTPLWGARKSHYGGEWNTEHTFWLQTDGKIEAHICNTNPNETGTNLGQLVLGTPVVMKTYHQSVYLDDTVVYTSTGTGVYTALCEVGIFGYGWGASSTSLEPMKNSGKMKIYGYSVKDGNGNYIAHFTPCKNASNQAGFYEHISETFKTSETPANLTAGND